MYLPFITPAQARDWMVEVPILGKEIIWNSVLNPSISFSKSGRMASTVTSLPVRPVPPVEMMASMSLRPVQSRITWRMERMSSFTILRADSRWPAAATRSASVLPDTSVSSERVSDIVRMAIRTGMNCLASLMLESTLGNHQPI